MTIDERAEECVKRTGDVLPSRILIKMGYVMGATEQREIDIDKAWKWMLQHINLIGSPIELHMKFKKAMEEKL